MILQRIYDLFHRQREAYYIQTRVDITDRSPLQPWTPFPIKDGDVLSEWD